MLPIFLVVLVDVFALTLVIPLLAIYSEHFGATPLQATLLVSIFAACSFVSAPLLGQLSDRFGRKPLLVVSQIGTLGGLLLMANATSLWMLYVARIIDGLTAGNLSLAQAYISDHTAPKERTKSFALIGIAFGVGFFVGPAITGRLAHAYGERAPILLAAALSLVSIGASSTLLRGGPPRAHTEGDAAPLPAGRRPSPFAIDTYARYLARPGLGGLLVQFFLFQFAFSTFTSGFALFAERRFTWAGHPFGVLEVGYVFAYSGFLGIVVQGGLIGRLAKRFGDPALVSSGFACALAGYVGLGVARGVAGLVVVATVSSFGNGVLRPALTSLVSQSVEPREQGAAMGVMQGLGNVAQVVAPALGGVLIGRDALGAWAWAAGVATAAGLVAIRWGSGRARAAQAAS
jgi:MFS family permease